MITIRQKSININRNILLAALRDNLDAHTAEYLEALQDYRVLIIRKLHDAFEQAKLVGPADAAKITVQFNPPQDHRVDYKDAIEMLEFSADEIINLDQESFKAYVKNEWSWTQSFKVMAASYKAL
jgi:hypothetical protein